MGRINCLDEVGDIGGLQTAYNRRGGIDLAYSKRVLDDIDNINLEANLPLSRPPPVASRPDGEAR